MRTSAPDVMAGGDCATVFYNPEMKNRYIPLATNAIREGVLIGKNLMNPVLKHPGTQGSSGIKIFDYNYASTGNLLLKSSLSIYIYFINTI